MHRSIRISARCVVAYSPSSFVALKEITLSTPGCEAIVNFPASSQMTSREFGTVLANRWRRKEQRPSRCFATRSLDHDLRGNTHPLRECHPPIPSYLKNEYWWAYVSKASIRLLDKQFLVNMVLWGNANTLRDAVLDEIQDIGRTLQVACVYGNFTEGLKTKLPTSSLDVIDVVPDQLESLQRKVGNKSVTLSCYNAEDLGFASDTFDQAVFYMLLHEMPAIVRKNAIQEAVRILRPGGKLIFVDFHRPRHMWRRFFISIWFLLEPFAKDLWTIEIREWFPKDLSHVAVEKTTFAGGLFQKVVFTKPSP